MLVPTCIIGLNTQSTDFINAFAQAELKQPVYLQPLTKYSDASWSDNPILKLNKSLYGQSEAPRFWYEKLKEGLYKHGFTPSKVEPWIFISNAVICVQYIDDCLWFYRDQKKLDKVLQSFSDDGYKYNWKMRVDSTVTEYLELERLGQIRENWDNRSLRKD